MTLDGNTVIRTMGATLLLAALTGAMADNPSRAGDELGDPIILRFVQGHFIWGWVIDQDENGLHFKWKETGDVLYLPWRDIAPNDRRQIQKQAAASMNPLMPDAAIRMVDAKRIHLHSGKVLEGRIDEDESTETHYMLKKKNIHSAIARKDVQTIQDIRLPETELYNLEELYERKKKAMGPFLKSAKEHFEMGEYLHRIGYHDKAREHLTRAESLDQRYHTRVQKLLVQLDAAQQTASARALYQQALDLYKRPLYQQALRKLQALIDEYPDSPEAQKAYDLQSTWENEFDEWLNQAVPQKFYSHMRPAAKKAAQNEDIDFEGAQEYARSEMMEDVLQATADELGIDLEIAREKFEARPSSIVHRQSYGVGSYFLEEQENAGDWWLRTSLNSRIAYLLGVFTEENMDIIRIEKQKIPSVDNRVDRIVIYR